VNSNFPLQCLKTFSYYLSFSYGLSIYLWEISGLLLLMHVYTFSSALLFADKPVGGGGGGGVGERERE
jgi:hypothetical protein